MRGVWGACRAFGGEVAGWMDAHVRDRFCPAMLGEVRLAAGVVVDGVIDDVVIIVGVVG